MFIISLLIILILSFLVVRPFLPAVILGAVIAYLFHPVYLWLEKYLKNRSVCAVITMLLILVVFTLPAAFAVNSIIGEISRFRVGGGFGEYVPETECRGEQDTLSCRVEAFVGDVIPNEYLKKGINKSLTSIYQAGMEAASSIVFSIPFIVLNILIIIFVIFYLFVDWDIMIKELDDLLPFKKELKDTFAKQSKDILYATVYGTLVVAVIQGAVGAVAFMALDSTQTPLLWGIVMAIAALVPFVGTALVWLPIGTLQIISGYTQASPVIMWKGVGVVLVGALIISTIDNVIKPKIIGRRASIHPLLVLLGVLGGLSFFGFIGIMIGPLLMALTVTFVRVYKKEKNAIIG
ncbi:MAG: AI-2E family transporter [Candidatus Woesearchaeota archaeon]